MLSDGELRRAHQAGELTIDPWRPKNLQPASYDLTLADDFAFMKQEVWREVRLDEDNDFRFQRIQKDEFRLMPGQFVLARTAEEVSLNAWLSARVEGRSSLGRLGLMVHATAGFIDPGFRGTITLELFNLGIAPIVLVAGRRICQLSVFRLGERSVEPYDSEKYLGQTGVRFSRVHLDREVKREQVANPS